MSDVSYFFTFLLFLLLFSLLFLELYSNITYEKDRTFKEE